MISPRYRVLEAIEARLAASLMPPPGLLRIGYINLQNMHAFPAVFITIGPGSTTGRQQHSGRGWEHRFVVRISWGVKGSDAEPMEARSLLMHDQILEAFSNGDRTLGGLCFDLQMVNDFSSDQGELALSGSPLGFFYQDLIIKLMVSP